VVIVKELWSEWLIGCSPLCQRFRKFRLEFKWTGPFRFLLTGIFGITSGGGPLISVGIFRLKFVVPFLTNRFFALIREFGRETNSGKSHSYWLAWFNRKMSFHFARKFPLISERSVWHNGKHPLFSLKSCSQINVFQNIYFFHYMCFSKLLLCHKSITLAFNSTH